MQPSATHSGFLPSTTTTHRRVEICQRNRPHTSLEVAHSLTTTTHVSAGMHACQRSERVSVSRTAAFCCRMSQIRRV